MSRCRSFNLMLLVWCLSTLLGAVRPVGAQLSQPHLNLSVGQAQETRLTPEAEHILCADLQQIIRQATEVDYTMRCEALPQDSAAIRTVQSSAQYRYHITLVRGVSHTAQLSIASWRSQHAGDFEYAQWMINSDSHAAMRTALEGVLSTFFAVAAEPCTLPESLLLYSTRDVELMSLKACMLEVDDNNLAQHAFEVDWQRYQDEFSGPRHFLRTSAEIMLTIGLGTAIYWNNKAENEADFDLPPQLSSLGKKLSGEAAGLDDNKFTTNTFDHPFVGAGYYSAARSNGYGPFGSFLFTLAGSSVWEYFSEYLEFVSINDQVFTPVGGPVIGEVMYQLGEFFTTSADTPPNNTLKWVFGTLHNLHRWVDDNPATRVTETDRFGLRKDIWHRFDVSAGFGMAGDTPIGEIRGETQLIHLPGYGTRRGDISAWINGTLFTQMQLRSSFSDDGLQDLTLFFKAMFLGYFRQHLTGPKDRPLKGYSFFIGPATAYEYHRHEWSDTGIEDTYAVIHFLGPSMDLTSYQGALRARMTMALYGDFAVIRAFAVDAFQQVGSLEGAKAVLRDKDYYFGLGLTARVRSTFQYDRLEMGTHGRYSYYNSIEGLDIDEEDITNDVRTTDTIASVGTWIAYEVIRDITHITFSYERRWRFGTATDGSVNARESETENRFVGSLLFSF